MRLTVKVYEASLNSKLRKFECEEDELNIYIRSSAKKNHLLRINTLYLCVTDSNDLAGYYVLSSSSIESDDVPATLKEGFPKYKRLPAIHIGRLARDLKFKGAKCDDGLKVGEKLVASALENATVASDAAGAAFVTVDAKSEFAVQFYLKFGFTLIAETSSYPKAMYMPISVARA